MNKAILANTDKYKVSELLKETEKNVVYFDNLVNNIVETYTKPLDNIMKNIYNDVIKKENPSMDLLEEYFLELTNCIYFMGEKLEKLGLYKNMAETSYKEVYDNKYIEESAEKDLKGKSIKTVAELQSLAGSASVYEGAISDIYDRAYAIVKSKIGNAQTMVATLSKVISSRLTEMNLTMITPKGKQILNEQI